MYIGVANPVEKLLEIWGWGEDLKRAKYHGVHTTKQPFPSEEPISVVSCNTRPHLEVGYI